MGYLALQIIGNAAFTLLVKVARTRRIDYLLFGAVNYVVGAVVGLVLFLRAGSPASAAAVVLGIINGVQYQVTFLLMYALLGMTGVAIMVSFLRLSVFIPTIASIALWHEWPAPLQAVGLALTAIALPLLGGAAQQSAPPGRQAWRAWLLIIGTLLISGAGLLAAKAFAELHQEAMRPTYLLAAYGSASVLSALSWPLHAKLPAPKDARLLPAILLGALTGLCNVGQLAALLRGLATVPGIVAFPVTAAGGLLVVAIAGRLTWKERLAGRAGAGIALALAAVALVNAG